MFENTAIFDISGERRESRKIARSSRRKYATQVIKQGES